MCNTCITTEKTIVLKELEQIVMLAETNTGDSAPQAIRTLSDQEIAAKIRFGDHEKIHNKHFLELTQIMATMHNITVEEVASLFNENTYKRDKLIKILEQTEKHLTKGFVKQTDNNKNVTTNILLAAYLGASNLLLGEAKRQGTNPNITPLQGDRVRYEMFAALLMFQPLRNITNNLIQTLTTPKMVAKNVINKTTLKDLITSFSPKSGIDQAKQTLNLTLNEGRFDTAEKLNPTQIISSELLDGQTCTKCSAADGKEYSSLESGRNDYPAGYEKCLGGSRCRGTLVFLFDL